jgi:hypothetical protein
VDGILYLLMDQHKTIPVPNQCDLRKFEFTLLFQTASIALIRALFAAAENSSSPEVTSPFLPEVRSSFRQMFGSLLPGILSRLARVALEPTLLHSGIKVLPMFLVYARGLENLTSGLIPVPVN